MFLEKYMIKNGPFVMKLGLGALLDIANILDMSKIPWEASTTPVDILRVECLLPQNRSRLAMLVADELVNPPHVIGIGFGNVL